MLKYGLFSSALVFSALALTACGENAQEKATDSAQVALQADGSTWTQVKADSRIAGYAVFKDPSGKYVAIDVSKFTPGMTKDQLLAAATVYSGLTASVDSYQEYGVVGSESTTYSCDPDTDINCDSDGTYTEDDDVYGYYWVDENIYTDKASGLVFEVGDTSSKDLASVSGALEKLSTAAVRNTLVMTYGLSDDRAQELASLAQSWNNVSKTRTMTSKDMVEFQSKVFGTDLKTVSAAAKKAAQGDSTQYNSLLAKAAALNNISPEQANSILQGFTN